MELSASSRDADAPNVPVTDEARSPQSTDGFSSSTQNESSNITSPSGSYDMLAEVVEKGAIAARIVPERTAEDFPPQDGQQNVNENHVETSTCSQEEQNVRTSPTNQPVCIEILSAENRSELPQTGQTNRDQSEQLIALQSTDQPSSIQPSSEQHNDPVSVNEKNSLRPTDLQLDSVRVESVENSQDVQHEPDQPQPSDRVFRLEPPPTPGLIYQLKWITYLGRQCPIILQSINGPCPLISILNALLLTKKVEMQPGVEYQSGDTLLAQVASLILNAMPSDAPEAVVRNYEQNIQDALAVLPKSQTGLDVNVKFSGPRDYELTPDTLVFDLLNIPLVHGWLPEPGDPAQPVIEKTKSYNALVEFIIDKSEEMTEDVLLAQDWLERTQSQLTTTGLAAIADSVANDVPCVFFRNNHFCTLVKHNDRLFSLATDQGYANEPSCVWEQISNIEGDTEFYNDHFQARQPDKELQIVPVNPAPLQKPETKTSRTEVLSPEQQFELDQQLALSLAQEAERLSVEEQSGKERVIPIQVEPQQPKNSPQLPQTHPRPIPSSTQSDYELARRLQDEEEQELHRREMASSRSSYQIPQNNVSGPSGPSNARMVNQTTTRVTRSTTIGSESKSSKCVIS